MQSKSWKSLLFTIFLAPSGVSLFGIGVNGAWAANSYTSNNPQYDLVSKLNHLSRAEVNQQLSQKPQLNVIDLDLSQLSPFELTNTNLKKTAVSHHYAPPKLTFVDSNESGKRSEWGSGFDKFLGLDYLSSTPDDSPASDVYCKDYLCKRPSELRRLHSQVSPEPQPDPNPSTSPNPQPNITQTDSPSNIQKPNTPPQLEGQPNNFPKPSSEPIERLLDKPQINYSQRLQKLQQLLLKKTQSVPESNSDDQLELGLQVRPRPQPLEQTTPPPPKEKPVDNFKPVGSLQGRLGYFYTNNIFSSDIDPVKDGLMFYGLTLASAYIPLAPKTYINATIDGYLIRYGNQSIYDYNQLRFNLSVYRQLSQRMYGEIAFSNQQLFYANNADTFKAGDRFLNENSIRLSLGRRDPLTSKLMLDSFYEFSLNLADPDNRNRIINSLWVSLSYYLQEPLQVGLDYQLNLSNFTDRPDSRADEFHRLFGHLNYRISNNTNMNLQGGVTFGSSTVPSINYDGWFFSVNYSFSLGQF
jgi:hypothetical protein